MKDDVINSAAVAIAKELGIQVPQKVSEEELLGLLAEKVAKVVQEGQDAFYSLMYRLDISERQLNRVAGTNDVAWKVARLIYERQLEKARSRVVNRQQRQDDDPELKW
jgi:hypothetical protein